MDTSLTLNGLLRAEIDLPDDAPHVKITDLLSEAQTLYSYTEDKDDRRTINRAIERLTTRIVPKQDGRIDPNLILNLINIGNEIEAVNAHRSKLYGKASALMSAAVDAGMSQAEVARIVGVDRSTVKSAVARPVEGKVSGVTSSTGSVRRGGKNRRTDEEDAGVRMVPTISRRDGTPGRLVMRQSPKEDKN